MIVLLDSLNKCTCTGTSSVNSNTVEPLIATTSPTATSFPNYQKFPSQITEFGPPPPCKQPPLISSCDHF